MGVSSGESAGEESQEKGQIRSTLPWEVLGWIVESTWICRSEAMYLVLAPC